MQYGQIATLATYLTALLVAVFLGRWLGRLPQQQLINVLGVFAALSVLVLLGLAAVILPSPQHE